VKAKTNYDKGDYDWTIKLSIATKVTTILTFDPFMELHFLPKDIIHSFSHRMLKPFTTIIIVFVLLECVGRLIANLNCKSLKIKILKNYCFWFFPT